MRCLMPVLLAICFAASVDEAVAQRPRRPIIGNPSSSHDSDNLKRLPNDQVEGTVWEYKGTLKDGEQPEGEPKNLEGSFRLEGNAVFSTKKEIKLPSPNQAKEQLSKLRSGESTTVKVPVPEGPQENRIGEYHKLSNGKIRIDLADEELHGIMIIWKKQDAPGVYLGTFAEQENNKTVRNWVVELRATED